MKIQLILICLALSGEVMAAISKQPADKVASTVSESALELLAMPEANRSQVAKARANELYPELVRISKSDKLDMATRWRAVTLAAAIGGKKGLKDLRVALKSREWFLRNAALVAMKAYHPKQSAEAARSLIKDKALVVRSAAVEVLGQQLDSKSRDLLWEELSASYNYRKGQSLWIRGQILSHLAEKPEAREIPHFVKALKEKESGLNEAAVKGLEKITDQKLGPQTASWSQKKELWLEWAKAQNPDINL
jgi:HEAT repeat protein